MTEIAPVADTVWHTLSDPWRTSISLRAFAEMLLIAPVAGSIGTWVSLGQLSYAAESFSHALLPGLVAAALLGIPLLAGAPAAALVTIALLAFVMDRRNVGRDTAVAVVVTSLFAAGVVLALLPGSLPRLQELLFGNVLGVSDLDLALSAALVAATLIALWRFHRGLVLTTFDRSSAPSLGGNEVGATVALVALIGAAVTVAVQALGNLLVASVLLAPAAAAVLLRVRLLATIALASLLAAVSGVGGIYFSYYAEAAVGSSICLTAVAIFFVVLALSVSGGRKLSGTAHPRTDPIEALTGN